MYVLESIIPKDSKFHLDAVDGKVGLTDSYIGCPDQHSILATRSEYDQARLQQATTKGSILTCKDRERKLEVTKKKGTREGTVTSPFLRFPDAPLFRVFYISGFGDATIDGRGKATLRSRNNSIINICLYLKLANGHRLISCFFFVGTQVSRAPDYSK